MDTTIKTANEFLQCASAVQAERGKIYDADELQEERSMAKAVAAFNAVAGRRLTETEGWLFMVILKATRAMAKPGHHEDSWLDLVSYASLAAESSANQPK